MAVKAGDVSDQRSLSVFPERVEFAYEVGDLPHVVCICVKVCLRHRQEHIAWAMATSLHNLSEVAA